MAVLKRVEILVTSGPSKLSVKEAYPCYNCYDCCGGVRKERFDCVRERFLMWSVVGAGSR